MADSLNFDGIDDEINFSIGGVGAMGPGSFITIMKLSSLLGAGENAWVNNANNAWRLTMTDTEINGAHLNTGFVGGPSNAMSVDVWEVRGITKASGTTAIKFHAYDGTSWDHTNSGSTVANSATPTTLSFGEGGNTFFHGNILIAGYWNTELADGTVETLTSLQGWQDANPVEAWRFDTMSAIQAFGTTGTADETSRTGTTLDTGDAPSWWSEGESSELQQDFSWHFG